MHERSKPKIRKFLLAIAVVAMLLVAVGVIVINEQAQDKPLFLENWDDDYSSIPEYKTAHLTVRGTIYNLKLNHEIRQDVQYHVFPAVIYINITEVVWASEQLMTEWHIEELPKDTWYGQDTIGIAYDKPDVPKLSKGQTIEASGVYFGCTISACGFKLVVAPEIEGS